MRPDVKLGVATSLVLVLVAGGYYLFRDGQEESIPVTERPTASPGKAEKKDQPAKSPAASKQTRPRLAKKASPKTTLARDAGRDKANQPGSRKVADSAGAPKTATPERPGTTPRQAMARKGTARAPATTGKAGRKDAPVPDRPTRSGQVPRTSPPATASGQNEASRPQPGAARPAEAQTRRETRAQRGGDATARRSTPARPLGRSAPTPTSTARPAATAVETHRVQPGDTFASLAKDYYGDEKYTQFLIDSNPEVPDPRRLRIGAVIKLPAPPPDLTRSASAPPGATSAPTGTSAARTYQVRPGDSFYGVARDVLGDAARWQELFELNKELVKGDPKRLRPGQVLVLPQS